MDIDTDFLTLEILNILCFEQRSLILQPFIRPQKLQLLLSLLPFFEVVEIDTNEIEDTEHFTWVLNAALQSNLNILQREKQLLFFTNLNKSCLDLLLAHDNLFYLALYKENDSLESRLEGTRCIAFHKKRQVFFNYQPPLDLAGEESLVSEFRNHGAESLKNRLKEHLQTARTFFELLMEDDYDQIQESFAALSKTERLFQAKFISPYFGIEYPPEVGEIFESRSQSTASQSSVTSPRQSKSHPELMSQSKASLLDSPKPDKLASRSKAHTQESQDLDQNNQKFLKELQFIFRYEADYEKLVEFLLNNYRCFPEYADYYSPADLYCALRRTKWTTGINTDFLLEVFRRHLVNLTRRKTYSLEAYKEIILATKEQFLDCFLSIPVETTFEAALDRYADRLCEQNQFLNVRLQMVDELQWERRKILKNESQRLRPHDIELRSILDPHNPLSSRKTSEIDPIVSKPLKRLSQETSPIKNQPDVPKPAQNASVVAEGARKTAPPKKSQSIAQTPRKTQMIGSKAPRKSRPSVNNLLAFEKWILTKLDWLEASCEEKYQKKLKEALF